MVNSVGSDETARYKPSHLNLQFCTSSGLQGSLYFVVIKFIASSIQAVTYRAARWNKEVAHSRLWITPPRPPARPTPYPPPALPPPVVYCADRSKAVVSVLLFVAMWFILRGDLFYVLPWVILFFCFSVLLALRLPRFGKREIILVLFVRLFDLRLFGFVCFLFLLVSWKSCGLWLWHSQDFSLTCF